MLKIKILLNIVFIGLFSANVIADINPSGTTLTSTLTGVSPLTNEGTITGSIYGISNTTNGAIIINTGTISVTGNDNHGISSFSSLSDITNSGSISVSGIGTVGIVVWDLNNGGIITNTGTGIISVSGGFGGIYSQNYNSTANNYGTITATGGADGIVSLRASSTNANYGTITTTGGAEGYGMFSGGANSANTNSGTITTSGNTGLGIYSTGTNSTNANSGTITTSGVGSHGIVSNGASSTITNSGTIRATGSNSAAIQLYSDSDDSTVNLLKGSVIVGDISNSGATGARLNINLGAGVSYAYSVTGPWTVTDLDNRPMVIGSAYAAGIGAQETASELLYQRTNVMNLALDRRLRSYASDEVDNQPYWLDVYYSDVTRNSGGNYSTQTAFSNYNYGITAGFKLPTQLTPLELVVNVEQSNLNIDSGNQKIDSSSIMAGFLAPSIIDVLGAKLSAKALLGYADHDGDRKVMTNSLLYNGSRQIKSDYNSTYAVLGTALTKLYPITDRLTADVILGIDLNTQRFESYKESDYFACDSRTLTQLHSRVQTGLDYKLWGDKGSVFARVGAEHRDLIGGATQDYSINGTNVSFNTNNKNDTYLTAQIGVRAQLEKRVHLFGVVNTLHSSDSVNSVSGNIGLRADF